MKLRIMIEQDEDGVFVAECTTLPGCISQGKTRDEAIKNIKDAIGGYIQSLKKHNEAIPYAITE
ncbi:MAG: type II toxin-antitoxin system HicB family antitoxin [Candidatus Micrarchaeota archaeon]